MKSSSSAAWRDGVLLNIVDKLQKKKKIKTEPRLQSSLKTQQTIAPLKGVASRNLIAAVPCKVP